MMDFLNDNPAQHLKGWNLFVTLPGGISNHMLCKMWDEITYPFQNFNSCTIEVWEWISNFIPHFIVHVITLSGALLITALHLNNESAVCVLILWNHKKQNTQDLYYCGS